MKTIFHFNKFLICEIPGALGFFLTDLKTRERKYHGYHSTIDVKEIDHIWNFMKFFKYLISNKMCEIDIKYLPNVPKSTLKTTWNVSYFKMVLFSTSIIYLYFINTFISKRVKKDIQLNRPRICLINMLDIHNSQRRNYPRSKPFTCISIF